MTLPTECQCCKKLSVRHLVVTCAKCKPCGCCRDALTGERTSAKESR